MTWNEDTPDPPESLLERLAEAPHVDPEAFTAAHFVAGTMLGERLRAVRRIGAGGMGVVWLAHHLGLDRDVAVKVHKFDDERGPERLLREAQAVAAINHPNVIVIHDVGRLAAGLVFVAMEYVEGGTLRAWCRAAPRRWSEVVDMFVQAARGLAAAHAVGLVHGDVKPDNLLVGTDGRVRVADFGLARFSEGDRETSEVDAPSGASEASGAMGTPAYMAPEQLRGGAATPASDQFALCVSLWEGLFGARPLANDGIVRPVAGRGTIPPRLRRVLERGLAEDPRARYVDMTALQRALERARRPGRAALRVLGVSAIGPALFASVAATTDHEDCAAASVRAEQVLPASRRAAIVDALRNVAADPDALFEVDLALTRWGERWGELAASACRDLRDREIDSRAFDDRQACLLGRARELDILLDVLATPDARIAAGAAAAISRLAPPEPCAEASATTQSQWRPLSEAVATATSRAVILQNLGQFDAAEGELRAALDDATLGASDRSEILTHLGTLALARGQLEVAARELSEGFEVARAAGDDLRALWAGTRLTHLWAAQLERVETAEKWWRETEALLPGLELDPAREADVVGVHATLLVHQGRLREAEQAFAHELEILDDAGIDGRSFGRGAALAGRARALDDLGDDALALRWYQKALEFEEASPDSGPTHGATAAVLNNMAACAFDLGRYEESIVYYDRAIEIANAVLGPRHPHTATFLGNRANSLVELGREAEALGALQQANAILRDRLGEHVAVAMSEQSIAALLLRMGRADEARLHGLDSAEIFRRVEGEGAGLVEVLGVIAGAEDARGDVGAARRAREEAEGITKRLAAGEQ